MKEQSPLLDCYLSMDPKSGNCKELIAAPCQLQAGSFAVPVARESPGTHDVAEGFARLRR